MTNAPSTDAIPVSEPWHTGLLDASVSVLVPCGFLYYGVHAMAAGWGMTHALVGLAGYLAGWGIVLMRINR